MPAVSTHIHMSHNSVCVTVIAQVQGCSKMDDRQPACWGGSVTYTGSKVSKRPIELFRV